MADKYANRSIWYLAGVPSSAFRVGQAGIMSIMLRDKTNNNKVPALNYRPVAIGTIPEIKDVDLIIEYAYKKTDLLYDFDTLPYEVSNVQSLLTDETGTPIALLSGIFYNGSTESRPGVSTHARRQLSFGALDVVYFGTLLI